MRALRRRYPQIYQSNDKLLIDPATIIVAREDFLSAVRGASLVLSPLFYAYRLVLIASVTADITPASHRVTAAPGRPLNATIAPLLRERVSDVLALVDVSIPAAHAQRTLGVGRGVGQAAAVAAAAPRPYRPRLLVHGPSGMQDESNS
jgi:hypothetical protein